MNENSKDQQIFAVHEPHCAHEVVALPPESDGAIWGRCTRCGDASFPVNSIAAYGATDEETGALSERARVLPSVRRAQLGIRALLERGETRAEFWEPILAGLDEAFGFEATLVTTTPRWVSGGGS